jgi:putative addiction module component (TIGR02574 family)
MDTPLTTEELLQKALGLPKESRAFMVEKLLQSLDHGEAFAIDPEWMDEMRRRCRKIGEGRVELIAAEQVFDEVDEDLG